VRWKEKKEKEGEKSCRKKTRKLTRERTDGGKNVSNWPLKKLERLFLCVCDNTPSLA
jgi:hypothetical protein